MTKVVTPPTHTQTNKQIYKHTFFFSCHCLTFWKNLFWFVANLFIRNMAWSDHGWVTPPLRTSIFFIYMPNRQSFIALRSLRSSLHFPTGEQPKSSEASVQRTLAHHQPETESTPSTRLHAGPTPDQIRRRLWQPSLSHAGWSAQGSTHQNIRLQRWIQLAWIWGRLPTERIWVKPPKTYEHSVCQRKTKRRV